MIKILRWVASNADNFVGTAALVALAGGFWMAWPPLGLIVPGGIVFGALAWKRIGGEGDES